MTQQSGSQFEDDLTIGIDEEETFATDSIDLLGIGGNDSSPIARLKTIILSIDWEINDDILQQLDDELNELGTTWAGDKIKQVYVQGLSKIGKYIYKEKAGAHPNAIKLLITFYHNLEKIIINEDSMSEVEKKELLLADVKKFDQLKSQIGKPTDDAAVQAPVAVAEETKEEPAFVTEYSEENDDITELKTLKAQVLGIDWEINDEEIGKLGSEVKRLEAVFSNSKPKLILLQGIGALSSYINKKRSQSNSGAFTLLHSFYGTLEKISGSSLSAGDEKQLLLEQVSKFNSFKAEIATEKESPASADAAAGSVIEPAEPAPEPDISDSPAALSDAAPAVTESPIDKSSETEDDQAVAADVSSRLDSVFGEDDDISSSDIDKNDALEGVNVETEADDDSDEEALPYEDGGVAPALAGVDTDASFSVEKLADDLYVAPPTAPPEPIIGSDIEEEEKEFTLEDTGSQQGEDLFGDDQAEEEPQSEALSGVDVETEADDDSDEESLPMEEGELAPALMNADEEGGFDADSMASEFDSSDAEAIEDRLGAFFDDEVSDSSEGWVSETADKTVEEMPPGGDDVVAALSDIEDEGEQPAADEPVEEQDDSANDELYQEEPEVLAAASEIDSFFEETDEAPGVASITEDVVTVDDSEEIFVDDDEPIAALSDSDESSLFEEDEEISPEQEKTEEAIADGLSFLDDDIDEPTEEALVEESATVIAEDEVAEGLSFLDDDIEEPAEEAAFEDSIPVTTEDAVADGLSFIDDDSEEQAENIPYEDTVEESTEEAVADGLSFLDDDIEEQGGDNFFEEAPVESVEEKVDFFKEEQDEVDQYDSPAVAVEDATEQFFDEPAIEDEVPEEVVASGASEETLSFFEDADEGDEQQTDFAQESDEDSFSFEVETEEISEDDEIEFTVPGDDVFTEEQPVAELQHETSTAFEPMAEDEEIEFDIPGEAVVAGAAVVAGSAAGIALSSSDEVTPEDAGENRVSQETEESTTVEEVVFEVVDDEVEVDLLPGEEFDDTVSIEGAEEQDGDESVTFAPVEETGKYESLAIMAAAIKNNVTKDGVQDILVEVNRLRSSQHISFTDKTFLQLLSTATQFAEQNKTETKGTELIEEIVNGLEMSDAGTHSSDEIQEKLFACTSQILVLQTMEYTPIESEDTTTADVSEEVDVVEEEISSEVFEEPVSEEQLVESDGYVPMGEEEQLASFVQKELADIRKLFVDEISSLRKELAEKK